jgi:hypothetical protein
MDNTVLALFMIGIILTLICLRSFFVWHTMRAIDKALVIFILIHVPIIAIGIYYNIGIILWYSWMGTPLTLAIALGIGSDIEIKEIERKYKK